MDVAEIVVEVRGELYMGPPKTRAGRRMVGLPRSVVEELAEHLAAPGEADGWVFTGRQGRGAAAVELPGQVWLPAIRAAGLAPLRLHDLRHTAVALWIAAGANPKEVSVRAGHTSVSVHLGPLRAPVPEGHDDELRERLDAMHVQGLQAIPAATVVELPAAPARPLAAPARPTADQATKKARRHTGPGLG